VAHVDDVATRTGILLSSRSVVSPVMGDMIARMDWSRTSLGPAEYWPLELRTMLDVVLASRFPMIFWWGPDLIQFYNDAYLPIMGGKHPAALGQMGSACWAEIWDVISPQIFRIYAGGPATWNEDVLLDINRHGFVGESYFTWSYSPMPDPAAPHGVGGVLCTVQETTDKVIGERRILLLRDLAAYGTEAISAEQECDVAAATIARYDRSVPFSLIYLIDEATGTARLAGSSGIDPADRQAAPPEIALSGPPTSPWPLHESLRTGSLVHVNDLERVLTHVPAGPWPEPPREAVVVPIQSGIAFEPAGFLVAGVNPREAFDERYGSFYLLLAGQIASAISRAREYENARKRAEALAELDRAKIEFFSNVSHEFRTPLTLMLGPLAELQRDADPADAPLLDVAHRNALRLLKLVNTLLEFSRLEAGRSEATFAEIDLAAATRELCGLFRSAVETAGLRFEVDIRLTTRVFVDRSMWEMIVLNLLSNALKFTHDGTISVTLDGGAETAELTVRDTGIGIPEADLPHIFERFRRVRGAKSRSHEGSGIGLALVDELARLHGGSVRVASEAGRGSAFTVSVPLGREHLDPAKIVGESRAAGYTNVVEQYLADVDSTIVRAEALPARSERSGASRVLLADDNGDLRSYVTRILAPRHDVVAVRNGVEALRALQEQTFDVIVSDVMMPEMDGFELVKAIRRDPMLETMPFIMLSARAGEGSAVEGLERGADDYVAKPFSAEELLARVDAQLSAAAIRERATRELRANEERFRTLASSMPYIVLEADAAGSITFLSPFYTALTGEPVQDGYGRRWLERVHPADVRAVADAWQEAIESGEPFGAEMRLLRSDGEYRWHAARALPQRDADGRIWRWTGSITDVQDVRRAVEEREFLSRASRLLAESLDLEHTLHNLAQLTVPRFADWCEIRLKTEQGRIQTVALAHWDLERMATAQQFVGRVHLNANAEVGSPRVIRTGRSEIIETIAPNVIDEVVGDEGEQQLYAMLGTRSAACIPLSAQGETLGAMAIVYGDSGRRFRPDDLPVLEELGRRAGIAVQNARLFEREHRVAQSFQEASLPAALPVIDGATFDAVYVPANDEAQVGGDWYDAVRLADGRVVVSIGDVAGNGLRAAVTMGNMRQIIRGIAQVHADPALMLDAADRALRLEHPDRFVTAFVGVFDPIAGTFAYASAGHPPPMLRRADGTIELLSDGGLPLGLRNVAKEIGRNIEIEPGSHLVFYTDGLTEVARRPADGEDFVRSLLADGALLAGPHPARAVRDAVFGGAAAKDDVAILVLGVGDRLERDANSVQRWFFDSGDGREAQAARRSFTDGLRARGADPDRIQNAEVVFGELVGNVARYAPGPVEVTIDWSCPLPVLHVFDNGPGFVHVPALPRDVYSESGRGLFIISLLSDDFSVSRRAERGSHARAVLALFRRAPRLQGSSQRLAD
jgi:PAS domain S-box-containing protein